MNTVDNEQMGLDFSDTSSTPSIEIVNADFLSKQTANWEDLFNGYDELYAITYSSGIDFINKVVKKVKHAEIIFGNEQIVSQGIASIISAQAIITEKYCKTQSTKDLLERFDSGALELFISHEQKSHEKIYVLCTEDKSKTRVITGSANMSSNAFSGFQKENIICFDNEDAFLYYKDHFDTFKSECADCVDISTIKSIMKNDNYLSTNIDKTPIIARVDKNGEPLYIEQQKNEFEDGMELTNSIKEFEDELKPMLPKQRDSKAIINQETVKTIKKIRPIVEKIKKEKQKTYPKLHIDVESRTATFNGKEICLSPTKDAIKNDIDCILTFFNGFDEFNGIVTQTKKNYFKLMTWCLASVFSPILRLTANAYNYPTYFFPTYAIVYGDSNGGKTSFASFLSKMMCGKEMPNNQSDSFTATELEKIKQLREGLPIIIDDLAKAQYSANYEKIFKNEYWGIDEKFTYYPAAIITTNKIPSLSPDITKRVISCFIDTRISKEAGAKKAKKIVESSKKITTAFFGKYIGLMFDKITDMLNKMVATEEEDYFPDMFKISSATIIDIIKGIECPIPDFVTVLSYEDFFGDEAIGRNAKEKLLRAWENNREDFTIDKKKNTITYCSPNPFDIQHLKNELPVKLNCQTIGASLQMNLIEAEKYFGRKLRKPLFAK